MSDERADLILNMLRAIRADQAAQREKLDEIITRLGALEREIASLSLRIAEIRVDSAGLSVRLDNLDRRVGRIEHRLELVDTAAPGLGLSVSRRPAGRAAADARPPIPDATRTALPRVPIPRYDGARNRSPSRD